MQSCLQEPARYMQKHHNHQHSSVLTPVPNCKDSFYLNQVMFTTSINRSTLITPLHMPTDLNHACICNCSTTKSASAITSLVQVYIDPTTRAYLTIVIATIKASKGESLLPIADALTNGGIKPVILSLCMCTHKRNIKPQCGHQLICKLLVIHPPYSF